jgi:hypothetical protein
MKLCYISVFSLGNDKLTTFHHRHHVFLCPWARHFAIFASVHLIVTSRNLKCSSLMAERPLITTWNGSGNNKNYVEFLLLLFVRFNYQRLTWLIKQICHMQQLHILLSSLIGLVMPSQAGIVLSQKFTCQIDTVFINLNNLENGFQSVHWGTDCLPCQILTCTLCVVGRQILVGKILACDVRAFELLLTSAWFWRSLNVEIMPRRACDNPNLPLMIN